MKNNFSAIMGRKRMKLTQVCNESGVSRTTLTSFYYERNTNITLSTLIKLCDCLEVSLNELVDYKPKN